MIFRNIRFKLTIWYIVILGIILTSFSTFLYLTLSRSLHKGIDVKIKSIAEVIASSSTNPYSQYSFSSIDRMMKDSFGLKPVTIEIEVQRVFCLACKLVRQVKLSFAKWRRTYTKAFERYALMLSKFMTILDVAKHLQVSWGTIKDIQKRYLKRRYRNLSLK